MAGAAKFRPPGVHPAPTVRPLAADPHMRCPQTVVSAVGSIRNRLECDRISHDQPVRCLLPTRRGSCSQKRQSGTPVWDGLGCGVVRLRTVHYPYASQCRISTSTWMGRPPVHTSDSENPAGCMAPEQTTRSMRVGDSSISVANASARPPSPHCRSDTAAAMPPVWRYSSTILCGFCAMTGLRNRSTSLRVSGS